MIALSLLAGFHLLLAPVSDRAAAAAQRHRLDRRWADLSARARAFIADPEVDAMLRGGGIVFDRTALFQAAVASMSGGDPGFGLLLFDPGGDPLAWAGRAPYVVPNGADSGCVWSASSVTLYRTVRLAVPSSRRTLRLVQTWRLPRSDGSAELSPSGPSVWRARGDPSVSLAISVARPPAWARLLAGARAAAVWIYLAAGALLGLLVWRRPRGGIAGAAAIFAAGAAGAAWLAPVPPPFDPIGFFRYPALLAGFALFAAAAAGALGRRRAATATGWRLAVAASIAGGLLGTIGHGGLFVAGAFALALAALVASSGGSGRPFRTVLSALLAGAAMLGPIAVWRETESGERAARERRHLAPVDGALERAARGLPREYAAAARRFTGASEQDLTDLAYFLWKGSGLPAAAPMSGIRLWREGRVVSSFAFGLGFDESSPVARRSVALPGAPEFPAGEAADQAELIAAGRRLPAAAADYLSMLAPRAAELSRRAPPAPLSRRLLTSVAAAVALAAVLLGLALAALGVRKWTGRPAGTPTTFRGRIIAILTSLILIPLAAITIFIRQTLASRLEQETVRHAETALRTARTVLDDYLSAAGTSPGRRQLLDDDLVSWMARAVGHDLSIYTDGRLLSTSRRELFNAGLLPERLDGNALARLRESGGRPLVETRDVAGYPFDLVEAPLSALPGTAVGAEPAVLSIPLLPEQRRTGEDVARLSSTLTTFTFLVFGIAILVGARVAADVTRPIGQLASATREVARGGAPEVAPAGDAELNSLVEAFRDMARTLAQQREELARGERLRAWAEMARMIAHEIKNPLTPIQLSAEHVLELWRRQDPKFGETLERCASNILRQTEELRAIASEFADYARLPRPRMEKLGALELLAEAASAFSGAPRVRVRALASAERVHGDRRLILRALANLIANSVEALGEQGGEIRLSAAPRGDRVVFRVEDDGPGVPPESVDRLFEPYFSTKTSGTGLGLAIVARIASEHGGTAKAENRAPRGFAAEFDVPSAG